jgi:hypothetical protein
MFASAIQLMPSDWEKRQRENEGLSSRLYATLDGTIPTLSLQYVFIRGRKHDHSFQQATGIVLRPPGVVGDR